jgi:hypothetical protein
LLIFPAEDAEALSMGSCLPVPSESVSWYRAEGNALSTIGTSDGTTVGGTSYTSGKVGQAFSFDGVDDGVTIPSQNIGNSYTIEMWVRLNSAPGGFVNIFGNDYGSTNVGTLFVLSDLSLRYVQQSTDRAISAGGAMSVGTFQHIALTRDGSDGITRIYVNGSLVASSSSFAAPYNNPLAFGRSIGGYGSLLNGAIDEAGIYSRALSAAELQAIVTADVNGKCDNNPLRIAPSTVSRPFGGTQTFAAVGGVPPYSFSIFTNSSGATINSATGLYTAGSTVSQDVVRVTDAATTVNDAVVSVTAPCSGSERVWDGGGSTNNWSDAWNWCNDQVPPSGAGVRFNATSTKNVAIDVSPSTGAFIIESGYTGTISISGTNTVISGSSGGSFEQAGGTFNVGGGTFTQHVASVLISGGTFNGGSGTLNIWSMGLSGGVFDAGGSTHNATNITMTGGHIVFTSGTMTISGGFNRSAGTGDFDNGTIVATGTSFGNLDGIYGSVNNFTINKADNVGITMTGTVNVLGTLSLIDGLLVGFVALEARGPVNIASNFGNATNSSGNGSVALRNGPGPRTVTLPVGVRMPELIVDDANVLVNTDGPGTINLDDLTLNAGSVEIGVTDLIIGYTTGAQGSHYLQTGGSFNISTGNIVWNTAGNFTMSNGTFNAGSGNVTLGGIQFILSGGTFTPSTGANAFGFPVNSAFSQSGGVFAAGAGSVDINGAFNLSGGTFNAPAGNMSVGYSFTHSAGTFNHNQGTLIFDSSHPSFVHDLPGNPGTGLFHNLVFAPTTDNANLSLGYDTWVASGDITINNARIGFGVLRPEGNFAVGAGADGGNAEVRFTGNGNQTFQNNGGTNPTGTFSVDKTSGAVTAASDMLLGASQALNIVSGTLYLADGSDLRSGNLTIGTNGRLVNDSSATITLGGNISNSGRIDLQGGGADCPGGDLILIRSTVAGTQRQWNGSGAFRIVDADIQDMAGSAAITAYSSTNSGNVGANWSFNAGCPAAVSISPAAVSLYRNQTQTFTAGGGFAPRTFSILQNNSGGFINPSSGLYTAGNTMNVTDTIRVTDAFGSTADATVNVIPGPPTRLVFTVQPSNSAAGQPISPSIQVAVQDNNGNTIPNATNAVTLNLLDNPGGSTLSGTVSRNAVNGIAAFNDISLNKAANGYTLQASASGLTGAVSTTFNVGPGAPAQLAFDQQPTAVYPNVTIQPSVRVAILDVFGNRVINAANPVTLSIGSNPGGGTLVNGGPNNPVNGYATFSARIEGNLNFGSGYTLIAASSGLTSATSQPFDVLSPFVVVNTNTGGLGSLRSAISAANTAPGHQTITFNIPGPPPHTINYVGVGDPITITDSVTIDGTTQPGYSGAPMIELNGSQYTAPNATALVAQSPNNTIKGLAFTGFSSTALRITSNNNIITGNYLGLSPLGVSSGNHTGIYVNSSGNLIGGSDPTARNVIGGNNVGITVASGGQNNIKGNFIGTAPDGVAPMPNLIGIWLTSGQDIVIGGTAIGDGNKIAYNTQDGIRVNAASVRINGNSIHSNNGPGIDLQPVGVNGNDNCDPDTGPNGKQNFPVISSVNLVGSGAQIEASLNSTPNQTFTIDYYANPAADPSGYGEGKTWIGSQTVTTGSNCSTGTFTYNALSVPADTTNITATATDSQGRTSEFSLAKGTLISIAGTVRTSANVPVAGVSVELRNSISTPVIRSALTDSIGRFVINGLNQGDNYFVSMTKANYTFSPPTRTYTALTTAVDDNYTANLNYLTISGKVSTNGVGVSGVTVTLSGAASRTATTDSSGNYAFSNLLAGVYTVTPSRTGFIFTPASSTQAVSTNTPMNFSATNIQAGLTGSIVFSSGNELKKINANGSGSVTLRTSQSLMGISHPAISKDGTKIVFVDSYNGMKAINYDGSGESTIIPLPTSYNPLRPRWSPDRSRLTYYAVPPNGTSEKVFTVNSNGTNPTQLTTGVYEIDPAWSANGNSILFRSGYSNSSTRGLYTIASSGGAQSQIVSEAKRGPSWAPNDSSIAFIDSAGVWRANTNGTNQQLLISSTIAKTNSSDLDHSPNSERLIFRSADGQKILSADATTGGSLVEHAQGNWATWGSTVSAPVAPGTNVAVSAGGASVQFSGVPFALEGSNEVTFDAISPESLGDAPAEYRFTQTGYTLGINGSFTPPASVCITIPAERYGASAQFQRLRLLHFTGGLFVDITSLPNNETDRTVCGDASDLGGFVVAELLDPTMPSISGQVVDANGAPIADHLVVLSGDEQRMARTDQEGLFFFTNLKPGGNYNVAPNQYGYLFDISSGGFDAISGENTIVFRGRAAQFSVSGRVTMGDGSPIAGVEVMMTGDGERSTTTGADGAYSFSGISANSSFDIMARPNTVGPMPAPIIIGGISDDLEDQDFVLFAPTAAGVSISGRVFAPDGRGLRNAVVTITDASGATRSATTSSLGYYRFEGIAAGQSVVVTANSRRYRFTPRAVHVVDHMADVDLVGSE